MTSRSESVKADGATQATTETKDTSSAMNASKRKISQSDSKQQTPAVLESIGSSVDGIPIQAQTADSFPKTQKNQFFHSGKYSRRDSISRGSQSSQTYVIGLYTDGTDFGEVELLQGARRSVGFRAASVLDLQSVSREDVWELAETYPKYRTQFISQAKRREKLYKEAVRKLTESLIKQEKNAVQSARKRIHQHLAHANPKLLKRSITGFEAVEKGRCA